MKKSVLIFVFIFTIGFVNAQTVKIEQLPGNIEDFVKLRNKIANTPEGGATIMLLALKIYETNKELGSKCLVVAVTKKLLRQGSVYKSYDILKTDKRLIESQLQRYPYINNSYIKGSSPENGYKVKLPYVYEFSSNPYSKGSDGVTYKIFVKCSGAASPRPITLTKNNRGLWKASSWSSVLVGIKPVPEDDDL